MFTINISPAKQKLAKKTIVKILEPCLEFIRRKEPPIVQKTTGANTADIKKQALHKKMKFSLRISSVDVTKSAENSGFGHTEEILNGKPHLLCS